MNDFGYVLMAGELYEEAEMALNRAISIDPDGEGSALPLYNLAVLCAMTRRYKAALATLELSAKCAQGIPSDRRDDYILFIPSINDCGVIEFAERDHCPDLLEVIVEARRAIATRIGGVDT